MTGSKSGSNRTRPARRVILTWLAVTLNAVLATLAVGERMRRLVFDSWQTISPRDLSATDVRAVMIDDLSIEILGPWPWSRYHLARLTEELTKRGAKVIAFDIVFPEYDRVTPSTFAALYPELSAGASAEVKGLVPMDQLFGQVIGASPVVLAHAGVEESPEDQPPIADGPITGSPPAGLYGWPAELAAIPELDGVALGHGLINFRPDSDGVIRSAPLAMRTGRRLRPGFAAEIARHMLEADSIALSPSSVAIDSRNIPIDRNGTMILHFGRFPTDKVISAALVLGKSDKLRPDMFAGKPVIVGVSAEGSSDIVATSLSAEEFGPLVQAQALDSILRGGWLARPPWAGIAEWAAAAMLALLALGAAIYGRAYRIFVAAAFAAVPLASWLAFSNASLLLDPAGPMLVGGGAVAGVALSLFALARMDRERLRETLVQERIATAEAEGELQAARAIQLGMVPRRERLRTLDPRVDLDALLEPAKSIGGDFYDAVKIGDDQIGFVVADVTGKGVPAALYMAMSKALTSAAMSRLAADPAAIAAAINTELLKDDGEALGVAMLLAILDLRTGEVRMVCAGHENPMLLSNGGVMEQIRLDGGPPLCVVDFPYPLERVTLKPGEILVLVTDGVTEAQSVEGNLFGRDRIVFRGTNSTAIIEAIREQVRSFEGGAEATDDLTVMAVRYLGRP
jgi:serine phosphatase RsbU (regulator of sigma subunit)/CHASE2 domain-containing sensor protein